MFVCRHLTLDLRIGSVGIFLILVKVSLVPVFSLNAGKYGLEKSPYLDTFHAVWSREKEPLSAIIVKIDSDKALVNPTQ